MNHSKLALIPIVAGVGEAIRIAGIPCKYIPFINLTVGLVLGLVLCTQPNLGFCAVDGLYIGLGASGLVRSSKEASCFRRGKYRCKK